jgi:hypothetical protein
MQGGDYLDSVRNYLHLDGASRKAVISELRDHYEDRKREFIDWGLSEEAAARNAGRLLGSPQLVAQQITEAYSQGSWRQAMAAAMPHLLVGILLAVRIWQGIGWLAYGLLGVVILFFTTVVVIGWRKGRPSWMFPWLSYYLLPVIMAGSLIVALPENLSWIIGVVYVPLALLVLFFVIRQTLKEDWMLASLMLMPIPVAVFWCIALGLSPMNETDIVGWRLLAESPRLAMSCLALGVTSVIFMRVKKRWVKATALMVPELGIIFMLMLTVDNPLGVLGGILLMAGAVGLVLSPAWLEKRLH